MVCHGARSRVRTPVYRLRTQNLRFIAPMPERIGNPTMYFPEVSADTYALRNCIVVVAICSCMGATNGILWPLQILAY